MVQQTEEKLERLLADDDHDDDECNDIIILFVLVLGANYFGTRGQWQLRTLIRPRLRLVSVLHTISSS